MPPPWQNPHELKTRDVCPRFVQPPREDAEVQRPPPPKEKRRHKEEEKKEGEEERKRKRKRADDDDPTTSRKRQARSEKPSASPPQDQAAAPNKRPRDSHKNASEPPHPPKVRPAAGTASAQPDVAQNHGRAKKLKKEPLQGLADGPQSPKDAGAQVKAGQFWSLLDAPRDDFLEDDKAEDEPPPPPPAPLRRKAAPSKVPAGDLMAEFYEETVATKSQEQASARPPAAPTAKAMVNPPAPSQASSSAEFSSTIDSFLQRHKFSSGSGSRRLSKMRDRHGMNPLQRLCQEASWGEVDNQQHLLLLSFLRLDKTWDLNRLTPPKSKPAGATALGLMVSGKGDLGTQCVSLLVEAKADPAIPFYNKNGRQWEGCPIGIFIDMESFSLRFLVV